MRGIDPKIEHTEAFGMEFENILFSVEERFFLLFT